MAFERCKDTGNIFASQTAYLDRSLEKFKINDLKTKKTPMEDNFKLATDDLCPNPTNADTHMMHSMIGTLMYLSIWTRPEISFAVNFLARHMSKASPGLIKAAQHVSQYLKGTCDKGITFFHVDPLSTAAKPKKQLYAYSNASNADNLINRRTTGGFVVFLNGSESL